jgi:hypothetical protein
VLAKFHGRNPLGARDFAARWVGTWFADGSRASSTSCSCASLSSSTSEFGRAIDETGWARVADYAASCGADESYLAREKLSSSSKLRRRRAPYTPDRPAIDPGTSRSSSTTLDRRDDDRRATRRERSSPSGWCAPSRRCAGQPERVRPYADEVVLPEAPEEFFASDSSTANSDRWRTAKWLTSFARSLKAGRAPAPTRR